MTVPRPLAALAIAAALAAGCGGTGGAPAAGPAASDEVISQRVIDYFQKTVTTPGLNFKVKDVVDAEVPGWRKGTLEVSLGQQSQAGAFFVSRASMYIFRGDAIGLTVDLIKKVMIQIALTIQPARWPAVVKVAIVEYSDFQCPFCARVYTTLEDQILKEYGDKVRFV